MTGSGEQAWVRRARPLLGTLVEVGVRASPGDQGDQGGQVEAAFAAVMDVQRCLSRFDPNSDVARFHALRPGQALRMRPATKAVLAAAGELLIASDGAFDISLGTGPLGWQCDDDELVKLKAGTRLDTGGIAKGYAVDHAVRALIDRGCKAGWVNAGGDLRAFGDIDVPVHVRDESTGGVRRFAALRQGAFATSHFDDGSRSRLVHLPHVPAVRAHVSVAAPQCLWADALTKLVAICGDTADTILARYQASAWVH